MNEQQLADLFSEQIDRILVGEGSPPPLVEELSDLLNLGQQLSYVNFQAGPAAQAAFQSQVTGWFGSAGGGASAPTFLGMPKGLFMAISAIVTAVGIGLGLIALLGSIFAGIILTENEEASPVPEAIEVPVLTTLEPTAMPPLQLTKPVTSDIPTEAIPPTTSSQSDTIPAAPSSVGDTVVIPNMTPEPTTEVNEDPNDLVGGDMGTGNSDTSDSDISGQNDDDRGHGNDPDGFDEDNPGKSDGVGLGNGKDNTGDANQGQGNGNGGGNGKKGGQKNN